MAADDEIDLAELFRTLWAGRWIIIVVTAVFLALGTLYLHVATYRYTAQLPLTPTQSSSMSKLGGLGGLASLAGINLPQNQGELSFFLYKEGVYSRDLANALVEHTDLMRVIFRSEWNARTDRWEKPEGALSGLVNGVKLVLGVPVYTWTPPDGARLQQYMKRQITVSEDNKNPLITLSFQHEDPDFAVRFLNALNSELDAILRRSALKRSSGNIEYLTEQLSKATVAEYREAIAQALSEQEKIKMASSSTAPFAAEPFGSAAASPRPTSPQPLLILIVSIMGGGILGSLLVLGRSFIRYQASADKD